jgi:chitosanase
VRSRRLVATAALLLALPLVMCGADGARGEAWPAPVNGPSAVALTAQQRRTADELVNVFEHSDITARYDVVYRLDDGRGYTCGTIGFTTSGTEVRDVVAAYAAEAPRHPLGRHLPRLRELAAGGPADSSELPGFAEDWADAAADPAFRAIQDAAADRFAYQPALLAARRAGVRTALGVAILFDAAVQHGTGDDPDGLPALIARAGRAAGGDPAAGVPEKAWLKAFLEVRERTLRDPADDSTRRVWVESVDRVEALRELVNDGLHRLATPLSVHVAGERYELN